ncbi:hypothetical protein DLD82_02975 [Methanospirillum stamsii]|uniref:Uncharacterized protein n=1 Tax=Methanospirillum stamsii TaxID=1277351 RepID=A0A2V2N6W2_9EURY|nr:hypothetical protein DLD82_02975 [Methanospirillum stamsii]
MKRVSIQEKDVRPFLPGLLYLFRMVGFKDPAGSGIPGIFSNYMFSPSLFLFSVRNRLSTHSSNRRV